jgi:Domain of unknown function (DUF6378)
MSAFKYSCQLCDTGYSSYEELIEHHKAKHLAIAELIDGRYHCGFCQAMFPTVLELHSHINIWHPYPTRKEGLKAASANLGKLKHPDEKTKAKEEDAAELKHREELVKRFEDEKRRMAMDVAIPPLPKVDEVSCILEDRGKRYSNFAHNAHVLQALKGTLHDQITWKALPFDSQLSIEMILLKIVRIVNGGMPDYIDNWLDIAGYATLVKNRIEGKGE